VEHPVQKPYDPADLLEAESIEHAVLTPRKRKGKD
jgi:hypothetical protein